MDIVNKKRVLYGSGAELVTRLFFTCRSTQNFWSMCDDRVGMSTTHHNQVSNHFYSINWTHWNIWTHSNNIIFGNLVFDPEEVFTIVEMKV